jgi:nicotinamidase-related amidase
MLRTAVLLIDLQIDFLDSQIGRMPVGRDAEQVINAAELVLSGKALPGSEIVAIVNAFPRSLFISNLFRNRAAIEGSPGAKLDPRIHLPSETQIFTKSKSNAFTNPKLHLFLQSKGISRIVLVGVYAEACIRATAVAAKKIGYDVVVPLDAIATNTRLKLNLGKYLMSRAGVIITPKIAELAEDPSII